jgi:hypothetical protein
MSGLGGGYVWLNRNMHYGKVDREFREINRTTRSNLNTRNHT